MVVCPTGAIHDVNFPIPVDRTKKPAPAAKPAVAQTPKPAAATAETKPEALAVEKPVVKA